MSAIGSTKRTDTVLANSGLSLTTPSSLMAKSAGCNASDLRKAQHTARFTFGRSGSIKSNTKAGAFFTVGLH
jgi:hypothetical protein